MKIRKLHIKNYKVFNDLELDFTDANGKTLDTIVLAGLNGSGKTTVLEIIRKMFEGRLFYNLMLELNKINNTHPKNKKEKKEKKKKKSDT